jgi:hypothetical protein
MFKCLFKWSNDFGDINVKESPIAKLVADDRMYHLLEHWNKTKCDLSRES